MSIIVNKDPADLIWPDDFINKIICGDCLEVMKKIPDGVVDLVLTDPPYGIDLQPQRKKNAPIQNDEKGAATKLWHDTVPELYRTAKDDSAGLVFGAWSELWFPQRLADWFELKGCICWDKLQFGIGYYIRPQFELAWYIHKGKPQVMFGACLDCRLHFTLARNPLSCWSMGSHCVAQIGMTSSSIRSSVQAQPPSPLNSLGVGLLA